MKKNGFAPVLIVLIIAVIGVITLLGYLEKNKRSDFQPLSFLSNLNSPINTKKVSKEALEFPRLVYTYREGIGTDNINQDYGVIYTINADGSEKKQLAKIDRNDFDDVPGDLGYAPETNEVIAGTENGISGIELDSGFIRTLYEGKVYNYSLSLDRKWIVFDRSGGYPNEPQYVQLNIKTKQILPIDQCHDNTSQFVNKNSNSLVTVSDRDVREGGAGTRVLSSNVILCNLIDQVKKTFVFDKGPVVPQFVANNYLYFVWDSSTGMSSLKSLQQMDLRNGQVDSPTSIPELNKKLSDNNVDITYQSDSLYGDHFLYTISDTNKFIDLYDHQLSTGKNTLIKRLPYSKTLSQIVIHGWSSDGNLVLFNRFSEDTIYIYNFQTKNLVNFDQLHETYTFLK